jgi:coenzyme F420-0:L-glutamate ligase
MEVLPLVLPRIERRRVLRSALDGALRGAGGIRSGDVLAVTSKVISFDEGRLVDLARVRPTQRAHQLARRAGVDPAFARVVVDEADQVFGAVPGAIVTLKAGHLIANAGADLSNAPAGFAVVWPQDPWASAERLRSWLAPRAGGAVGMVVTDSHCEPLRMGTSGVALACAGFLPVEDVRGRQDLFGHVMRITFRALADSVASAAVLAMGEVDESTPAAIVRGAPIRTVSRRLTAAERRSASIPPDRDLFSPVYRQTLLRAASARGR